MHAFFSGVNQAASAPTSVTLGNQTAVLFRSACLPVRLQLSRSGQRHQGPPGRAGKNEYQSIG